jgi:hypothetical protein
VEHLDVGDNGLASSGSDDDKDKSHPSLHLYSNPTTPTPLPPTCAPRGLAFLLYYPSAPIAHIADLRVTRFDIHPPPLSALDLGLMLRLESRLGLEKCMKERECSFLAHLPLGCKMHSRIALSYWRGNSGGTILVMRLFYICLLESISRRSNIHNITVFFIFHPHRIYGDFGCDSFGAATPATWLVTKRAL